jgi:hypothetical protein
MPLSRVGTEAKRERRWRVPFGGEWLSAAQIIMPSDMLSYFAVAPTICFTRYRRKQ